jgi:diguanylate cyclase (GGDEF)-like protein
MPKTLDVPARLHQDGALIDQACNTATDAAMMLDLTGASRLVAADVTALLGELLPAVIGQRGEMLAVKEADSGRYVHVDAAMAAFVGRAEADIVGRGDGELFDAAIATALRAADHTARSQGAPLVSEHVFEWAGARREYAVLRIVLAATSARAAWICSVWSDQASTRRREVQLKAALTQIEHLQRANDDLRRELADQALRDPVSGLYRSTHFEEQLRRELDLSAREHREFAVVLIEIDPLEARVCALGEAGAQSVMEGMGRLLRGSTRAMDASCRYDAGRFAVMLSGVGLATAHARMESLRRKCATQVIVHAGQELTCTASMGVASFPHTATTQDELIAACEAALAEARRRGGNQVALAAIRFEGP